MLIALAEIAWRGHSLWALAGLVLWCPLAWFGLPPRPALQSLLLEPQACALRQAADASPMAIDLLPGTVLLPWVVVLHWRPAAGRGRRFLWLWARDLGDDSFRDLRRWWLVFGQKGR
ncbi:hypothetical protein Q6D67_03470 [Haliea sp. E1-2-M8]|uniref:hypothetical protein n=1 Tax=Haliea sp. E1-2-M8 TaxID=3064706 RepID=UPI002716990B|nr:hypothetical protein [Haliea sp. E1-2-M8]MDO8860751.1 hypothetical protein [Haliea sp. E1-2-M8]